jgi:hypothetical protein
MWQVYKTQQEQFNQMTALQIDIIYSYQGHVIGQVLGNAQ